MASRFAAPVSDAKECSSAIPVKANVYRTKWGIKLWADWSRASVQELHVEVDPLLSSSKPNKTLHDFSSGIPRYGKQPVGKNKL